MPKTCRVCKVEKSLREFYSHPNTKDGRAGICKDCQRQYVQGRYNRKRPVWPPGHKLCPRCKKVLPLKKFGVNAARKDGRQVYCLDCWPAFRKFRAQNPINRWRKSERAVEIHRRNPLKHRARLYVSLAVKFGDLKPQPCEVCGMSPTQAHHDDYTKPLAVRWLCVQHHNEHHKEEHR